MDHLALNRVLSDHSLDGLMSVEHSDFLLDLLQGKLVLLLVVWGLGPIVKLQAGGQVFLTSIYIAQRIKQHQTGALVSR